MDGFNADIKDEQLKKLRDVFPEVFTEGKIDWDKLKATLGSDIDLGERYGLSWKGKSSVFATIQEKTVSTLHPQPEESVDWDTTQNMFIEGDNLEALKVLHKAYYGKVKMIYIDPPYNTGNDFVYNDDFAKTRKEQAFEDGSIDEEGNVTRDDGLRVNTGGHKHSNWLDMMYPRLFLARNLLRQDGVIFVSIDDNEVHNLRLMMNEIFGEENFVAQLIWEKKYSTSNNIKGISYTHDYVLCYVRSSGNILEAIGRYEYTEEARARFKNQDNDPRGDWSDMSYHGPKSPTERPNLNYAITHPKTGQEIWPKEKSWAYEKSVYETHVAENRLWWGKNFTYSEPRIKKFFSELEGGLIPKSILNYEDFGTTSEGRADLRKVFGKNDEGAIFDNPKPVLLLQKLCEIGSHPDSIVMDFFGGSGTLGQAVMELNAKDGGSRKYIIVQLPEHTDEKSEARLAGYEKISDIAKERIRRAGAKINKDYADKVAQRDIPFDLGFRSYTLGDSNFKKWNELVANSDELKQQTLDQLNPLEDGAKDEDILTEILLKRGISPLAEIETHDGFVFVPAESLVISLSRNMTEELFTKILTTKPSQIILLDQTFNSDVNLKTNLILQAEKQSTIVEVV